VYTKVLTKFNFYKNTFKFETSKIVVPVVSRGALATLFAFAFIIVIIICSIERCRYLNHLEDVLIKSSVVNF